MAVVTSPRAARKSTSHHIAPPASSRALLLPLLFIVLLAAMALLPQINPNVPLVRSFLGAAAVLLLGLIVLWRQSKHRHLQVEISLRAQHYLQASMQGSFF